MLSDRSAEKFAEEKFRLVVEACPSAMVMTDPVGTIVLVNTETERLFGYRRDALIGRPMEMLVPLRLRGEYLKQRAVFTIHPEARRVNANRELFGLRRDGAEVPIEVWLNPIHTHGALYVLCVMVDISERKRIDQLKDEFVSTVSHELRTPLTSIAGSLGLLVGGAAGALPETALRLLTIAQTNSQRLVRLINDILDIEKIESGQVVFDFRRISMRALAEQVVDANRVYADGFAIHIRLESGSTPDEVLADQDRLAQVLTNLLSNAIKFSPRGGEVTIGIELRGGSVRISVRDHGDGIPPKFKPHIFQKFAQADATDARQKGGTGLGLSIVKEIVTRLGGSVGFDDADGGGTVFFVELPAWTQIAARETDAGRGSDAVRVLICEDNPDAAERLREGLRPLGYSADFAHNPADAAGRARTGWYAAIVVDFELPDGNGLGLIRLLREQPESYKTPIVVMSAEQGEEKDEAIALKVVKWIGKPADVYELAQILDGMIARGANGKPRVLHIDDDPDVLELVARTLEASARVVSVASVEEARCALAMQNFDLVVLDITLGRFNGLDLLPELRNRRGVEIPVIVFSGHSAEFASGPQVEARFDKSGAALDDLVAAVNDRLMLKAPPSRQEVA